jgi:hypothetical protein
LQIQAFAQPGKCAAPSPVEGFAFPHDGFEPVGQKGTDRPSFLGRHDTRLAQKVGIELERDTCLHDENRRAR